MDFTELSLAGGWYGYRKSSEGKNCLPVKRKWNTQVSNADLQLKHPLPSDWEQCLDLQSGRMYCVNRKTARKSWMSPEEPKLDLELTMSTGYNSMEKEDSSSTMSKMVALACSNCHLLVILSRSSPSCPNCKYVHSLASSSAVSIAPSQMGPSSWS